MMNTAPSATRIARLLTALAALLLLAVGLISLARGGTDTAALSVKLVDGLSPAAQAAVIARHGAVEQSAVAALRIHVAQVPAAELAQALQAFAADPQVESVEAVKTRRAEWLSNDPYVGGQWSLARIGWPTLYSTLRPTGTATVALLDTGVDGTHPDLQGNLRPGTSFLDGGDGLTDPAGHGTQLAGLIAAVADNQQGIAGVAFSGVKVMPVRVLDAAGVGQDSAIVAGIVWAADHGADVILMGFGNPDYSQHLQDAIDYAWSKGAVLVAAAGNAGATTPSYPAANRAVVGIAASDPADRLAGFSNRGGAIFLAAPGTELATTDRAGGYATVSGTSPAAALVAGAAALLKAAEPTLTNGQVLGRLARGAAPIADPQEAPAAGFGRVDLAAALADTGTEEPAPLETLAGVYGWATPAALAAAEEAAAPAATGATDPAAGTAPLAPADTRAAAQPADYTAATSDPVLPNTPVDNFPMADSAVMAVAVDSATGITYIGGYFRMIGTYIGTGAPFDTTTGQVGATFPKVDGGISAVAADGSGGWYIGGDFTSVNGVTRNHLAHIQSDGTLDTAWNPNADGAVEALAVSTSTVYAGGHFTTIGGTTRNHLAAITTTGTLGTWNPDADDSVWALALSGTSVYAGGQFTTIGGTPRNHLAAITTTGTLGTWNPNANDWVWALAVGVDGTTVYAGGDFTTIGAMPRNKLAAITTGGTLTNWNPNSNDTVFALAVSGTTVYAGGFFSSVGGATHNYLASINAATGSVAGWDPGLDDSVNALAVSGTSVYAGGDFTTVASGATTRKFLAAFDTATGAVTAWNPNANGSVGALAVGGTSVYAGGWFNFIGADRYGLAAIAADGTLTGWNPNANMDGLVSALVMSGTTVYVGGSFSHIGSTARNNLAAIGTNGTLATWNPNPNNWVQALAVSGSTVYVGGGFTIIGTNTRDRNRLAAIAADGTATTWNPNPSSTVKALAVSPTTLYVGGEFTTMGTTATTRNRLAAFDTTSGALNTWDPNAGGSVNALAVSGSTVYAGGDFSTVNGTARNHLAAIGTNGTGTLTGWDPNADHGVYALAVSGTTVYAGGWFSTIGGANRNGLAAVNADTGTANAWNPHANGTVHALAVNGSTLYAVGNFGTSGVNPRYNLTKFQSPIVTTTTSVAASPNPAAYGAAVTLTATLSPTTATGSVVTFMDDTTTLGTGTLAGGSATYVTSTLAARSHSITAVYPGDTGFGASTSAPYTLTIGKADQTITFANPGSKTYGTSPTLGATATSGLAVSFTSATSSVCTVTTGGALTFVGVGSCTINADQGGNANYNAATRVTQSFAVAKGNPSVTAWPSAGAIHYGQTLAASTLSGGTASPGGSFAFTTPATAPGVGTANQGVTFTPTDSAHYNSAAGTVSVTVDKAPQAALSVTGPGAVTYGATGTATATGGSGTGALSFSVGSSTGCAVTGTTVSVTNASGTCALTATRAGDGNYDPGTSAAATVTLNKAGSTATLVSGRNPATLGAAVLLTATVTPAGASGTVTFMDGTATLGTGTLAGGTATLSTTLLTAGSHSLTAVYAGDANCQGATASALTQVVQVPVTVGTSVAGLGVSVDGSTYASPYTVAWTPGSSHTIAVSAVPSQSGGSRYAFASWSDGGALSHTVTAPAVAANYTAALVIQYQLTTAANAPTAALITPATGGWYATGTTVPVTVFPVAGYAVVSWTVGTNTIVTAATSGPYIMSGPLSITVNLAGGQPNLLGAVNAPRTGTKPYRTWSLSLTNRSTAAGPAQTPRFDALTLTQTYPTGGTPCTPVVGTLPTLTGPLAVGATLSGTVGIDFTGCNANARFQATIGYSDGGRAAGTTTQYNQPQ